MLVSLNASLEPYNGSRSQKSHNNIRRMLSVVYFEGFFIGLRGGFEKHSTRASLHSDTVEDLIRISVEGSSLEDVDARESVASRFSQSQRSRRINYRRWPSEGHVTVMEDSP